VSQRERAAGAGENERVTSLEAPLWRAITVFRFASLAYVGALVARNFTAYAHSWAVAVILAAMVAWTAAAGYLYARPAWRRWPLLLADLGVTMVILLVTPWAVGRSNLAPGMPTLSVAWLAGPVLAWAVSGGRRRGAAAAIALGVVDLTARGQVTQGTLTGTVLMLLAGIAVGHVARLAVDAEARMQRAVELEAASRERERLARGIHDSVLQVLAMVRRRGVHLDGEAGELARLAGEQEAALRALIAGADVVVEPTRGPASAAEGGTADDRAVDLRASLAGLGTARVSIAGPATPVRLPAAVAGEVVAAVRAALDNVAQHCAGGARAWVLVEDEPAAVTVTIRDDGPGIPDGRLAEAAAQGRLGVLQSIRGRVRDLGGSVQITSPPGEGTEVELRVPR
jgi:signal transduction histidine kinase